MENNRTAGSSAPGNSFTDIGYSDNGSTCTMLGVAGTLLPGNGDTDISDTGADFDHWDDGSTCTMPSVAGTLPPGDSDIDSGWDTDSAIGDSDVESTCTTPDEVPVEENGRTYFDPREYSLPNDKQEQERLNILHWLWLVCYDGALVLCPRKEYRRVLDLGTGTGIWPINFADKHPDARVFGVDLSAIQLMTWVPENCVLQKDNVEEEWTWRRAFDLIHARMLSGCFKDPRSIVNQAFKNLSPGGYFEAQDIELIPLCDDGTLKDNSPLVVWARLLDEAARKLGRPINLASRYEQMLIEAGFTNVQVVEKRCPTNRWAEDDNLKLLGYFSELTLAGELETISMVLLTHGLGWALEEVIVLCALVRQALLNPEVHVYFRVFTVFGMKPLCL